MGPCDLPSGSCGLQPQATGHANLSEGEREQLHCQKTYVHAKPADFTVRVPTSRVTLHSEVLNLLAI